jgi:hypothetical protein
VQPGSAARRLWGMSTRVAGWQAWSLTPVGSRHPWAASQFMQSLPLERLGLALDRRIRPLAGSCRARSGPATSGRFGKAHGMRSSGLLTR